MEKKDEKIVDEMNGTEEKKEEKKEDILVEVKPNKVKTILKWVGAGVALIATGLAGFFIGRGSDDDDDDSTETKTETATEE